jgi:hypothetical protein
MSFEKSSPERIASFDAALPVDPRIQKRKMFGYPAAFVNGNFFTGLHEENVVIRLPLGLEKKLPSLKGAGTFDPMGGRPMKAWFVIPKAAKLQPLLAEALELVATLETKQPKAKKPKAKSPAKAKPKPKKR